MINNIESNISPINILKIGNLDTTRDVTDVRDIANAFFSK
jgi:GDP-D-mannose dehydratase